MLTEKTEEQQTPSGIEGAMASAARHFEFTNEDNSLISDPHLPEPTEEPVDPPAEEPKPESPAPEPDPVETPTPEEEPAPTATPRDHQEPTQKPKPTTRFKSHEAAEAGYRNVQARATRVEQENAALKKAIEEANAKTRATAVKKKRLDGLGEFARTAHEQKLDKIAVLDPDDPEYNQKVAIIQADADLAIEERRQTLADDLDVEVDEIPLPEVEDPLPDEEEPEPEELPEEEEEPRVDDPDAVAQAHDAFMSDLDKQLKSKGLSLDDPIWATCARSAPVTNDAGVNTSMDDQIDWAIKQTKACNDMIKDEGLSMTDPVLESFFNRRPQEKDNHPIPVADQIEWVINQTKNYKAEMVAGIKQDIAAPLGRSGSGRAVSDTQPDQPRTLGNIMDGVEIRRRL